MTEGIHIIYKRIYCTHFYKVCAHSRADTYYNSSNEDSTILQKISTWCFFRKEKSLDYNTPIHLRYIFFTPSNLSLFSAHFPLLLHSAAAQESRAKGEIGSYTSHNGVKAWFPYAKLNSNALLCVFFSWHSFVHFPLWRYSQALDEFPSKLSIMKHCGTF